MAKRREADGPVEPAEVRLAAMNLLARREHSRLELKQKLSKRFGDEPVIDEQLERLADERLQCNARYAESFVRQRFNRGHGPRRIRQEMRLRGIPEDGIEGALLSGEYDWAASARAVLEKKFGVSPAKDIRERARRGRFMQARGFSPEHFNDDV